MTPALEDQEASLGLLIIKSTPALEDQAASLSLLVIESTPALEDQEASLGLLVIKSTPALEDQEAFDSSEPWRESSHGFMKDRKRARGQQQLRRLLLLLYVRARPAFYLIKHAYMPPCFPPNEIAYNSQSAVRGFRGLQ